MSAIRKGAKVRVVAGIKAPDLTDFEIAGWTGVVSNVSGKKEKRKVFIEWDDSTLAKMPADYVTQCEERQLLHAMSCLKEAELEVVE